MNLGKLVVKYPGLIYPDLPGGSISPGGLIGFLQEELRNHEQYDLLCKMAEKALPAPKEQH